VIQKDKCRILFVAHKPPPWTGQGVIHQLLMQGDYSDVILVHLPMSFSNRGIYLTPQTATGCGLTRVANGVGAV